MKTAIEFMCRHFVAYRCIYQSLNRDGSVFHEDSTLISGFIMELHGCWFWVTAGHCLKENLEDRIERKELRIIGGSFIDYCGYQAEHTYDIPFMYDRSRIMYLADEGELG